MPDRRPEALIGAGGQGYYTVPDAALLLGVTRSQVDRDDTVPKVSADVVLEAQLRPGRPTKLVVPADIVDAKRADMLNGLFAVDTREAEQGEVRRRRAAVAALEGANSDLRQRVSDLEEVIRLSLVADGARLEQVRQLLGTPHLRDVTGGT